MTLVVAVASAMLLVAGCGASSNGGSASPAASSSGGGSAANEALLQNGYQGHFEPPPTSGPKAVPGKNVWNISCGQKFATCAYMSSQFAEAGKQLGWNVTIQDSKGDPTTSVSLMKQAVAAKVDAITVESDCPNLKSGIEAARAAHIPVVAFASDCDDPGYSKAGAALYTAKVNVMGSTRLMDYYTKWSAARGQYLAGRMPQGGKVLQMREITSLVEQTVEKAFEGAVKQNCPKCELVSVDYGFNQLPNPATQIWKSALLSNPDARAITVGSDQIMGIGMQTAIEQSPLRNKGVLVVGGEGGLLNYDLIRKGVQTASVPIPYSWMMWALADTLNRVFSGADPASLPSEGGGWQFVDKDHNLPPQGQQYEPPVDFRSAYKKIWSGQ